MAQTFAEMTPEKWRLLVWLAVGLGFVVCVAVFVHKLRKKTDCERGDSPRDW